MLLLALFGAGPAAAQTPSAAPSSLDRATYLAAMDADYRRIDANSDGSATRAEVEANQQRILAAAAAARAAAAFARLDTDRNGQLSPAEFARLAPPEKAEVTPVMTRLDANRDGRVTLVEYRTLTLARFDQLDGDKDGRLSPAEQRAGTR
jgi:hypothetical protein